MVDRDHPPFFIDRVEDAVAPGPQAPQIWRTVRERLRRPRLIGELSTQPVQATQGASAKAIVDQFYQDLNAHNYQAAWQLGGSNLSGGAGYGAWAAGYATTASIGASTVQDDDGTVSANITATQTDGSVKTYAGTYTVANGVIVAAHIS